MKKRTTAIGIVLVLIAATVMAQTGKTDFSGSWVLNKEKSGLQEGARFVASKLVVKQAANTITIARTVQRQDQERVTIDTLTLDGKERTSVGAMNAVRKFTAAWSQDGKTLTIKSNSVFERDGNKFEMSSTEILSLKDDGKTLSIDSASTSPRGERKAVLVYDKAAETK